MQHFAKMAIIGGLVVTLAACGGSQQPTIMNIRNTEEGPDEFSIVPTRPLEIPANLGNLPPPTRGGTNRTDPTPQADAIAALGGNVARAQGGGGDVVTYASRFGVGDNIREVLASEDLRIRSRNRGLLLERAVGTNTYYRAYRNMSLDQQRELERLRAAGVRTPEIQPRQE